MGFGPTTSTLARLRSTPELRPHVFCFHHINMIQFHSRQKFTQARTIWQVKYVFLSIILDF